ncbi:hypothetical protein OID55_10925 [Streptomyces sp. NBC_00715]|uniref:hypothetical protein n=1 Tax=Streptomyces sp. NBC_00715 TaxID=2975811 RepID=UPI00386AB8AD
MDEIEVPARVFDHLLTGFICDEGADLARFYKDGQVAHPGDAFGSVFAWLWESHRESAVAAFATLLAEARRRCEDGEEVSLDDLITGLRFALHRSRLAQTEEFAEVERTLRAEVPDHFGGRTDL